MAPAHSQKQVGGIPEELSFVVLQIVHCYVLAEWRSYIYRWSLFMASLFMTSLFMASYFPDLTVAVFSVELCLIIMYDKEIINYCILIVKKKKKKKKAVAVVRVKVSRFGLTVWR